ncbi:cell division cycle 25 homolog d [Lepisosteus oculatus]|uniref:cell division cycle 25 homolog d n=1 Tax=Lepisosteus oculatus TaxID=7918 RepID=UPI003718311D
MDSSRQRESQLGPENGTIWTFSPSGLSPVSELSAGLGDLDCQDSTTPRRRLWQSPEQLGCSPAPQSEVSAETQTPTEETWGAESRERWASPKSSLSSVRRSSGRSRVKKKENDSIENKENARKRLRVKLSSLFPSPAEAGGRRDPSSQAEENSGQGDQQPPAHRTVFPLWGLQSGCWAPALDIPHSAIQDRNLIGDFSKPHLFAREKGEHQDLQYVSGQTVASLLLGEYSTAVRSFLIVDCRYPYEYQGGHIKGAVNLHSEAQVEAALLHEEVLSRLSPTVPSPDRPSATGHHPDCGTRPEGVSPGAALQSSCVGTWAPTGSSPRRLLIFHCEFSSERGPWLCRYLRKMDRRLNAYPRLFYPELYVLAGGYKEFYSHFESLCEPCSYVPMLQEEFSDQMHRYRRKRRTRPTQFGTKQLLQ